MPYAGKPIQAGRRTALSSSTALNSSWPGLTRPSILFPRLFRRPMDTRVKPAYDEFLCARCSSTTARHASRLAFGEPDDRLQRSIQYAAASRLIISSAPLEYWIAGQAGRRHGLLSRNRLFVRI